MDEKLRKLMLQLNPCRENRVQDLAFALVWAEIYSLTRGTEQVFLRDQALADIALVRIDSSSDQEMVTSIAGFLGMTKEELYELCKNGK